jgi:hypothetical protein
MPPDMTPKGQVKSWTPKSTTIPSSAANAEMVDSPTAKDREEAARNTPNKKNTTQKALRGEFDKVGGRRRKSRKTKRKSKSRRTRRRS